MEYRTEDGVTVNTGDVVYNYYDMEPGVIGRDCPDGWFHFHKLGSRYSGILNGPRICTLAFAVRRGFRGADDAAAAMRSRPEGVDPHEWWSTWRTLTGV